MKKITYLLLTGVTLMFLSLACNQNQEKNGMEITGTIQEQGMTSYQYGTHILINPDTFYAVKSDSVNLNQYLNQSVKVTAEKIEGYPVDGGPEYLRILSVESEN